MSDARVRLLRERATELRKIADALSREADALERSLSPVPLLGGIELVNVAVALLTERGAVGPDARGIHYRELIELIETSTGMRVRGVDPFATLLANLGHDPRTESAQSRSGRYRVRA